MAVKKVKVDLSIYTTKTLEDHFDVSKVTIYAWKNAGEVPIKYSQKIIDLLTGGSSN